MGGDVDGARQRSHDQVRVGYGLGALALPRQAEQLARPGIRVVASQVGVAMPDLFPDIGHEAGAERPRVAHHGDELGDLREVFLVATSDRELKGLRPATRQIPARAQQGVGHAEPDDGRDMLRGEVGHQRPEEIGRLAVGAAARRALAAALLSVSARKAGEKRVDVVGHGLHDVGPGPQLTEQSNDGIPLILVVRMPTQLADQQHLLVVSELGHGDLRSARPQAAHRSRRGHRQRGGQRWRRRGVSQGQRQSRCALRRPLAGVDDLGRAEDVGRERQVHRPDHHRQQRPLEGHRVGQLRLASLRGQGIRTQGHDEDLAGADALEDHVPPQLSALHLPIEPGRQAGQLDVRVQGFDCLRVPARIADEGAHRSPLPRWQPATTIDPAARPLIHPFPTSTHPIEGHDDPLVRTFADRTGPRGLPFNHCRPAARTAFRRQLDPDGNADIASHR